MEVSRAALPDFLLHCNHDLMTSFPASCLRIIILTIPLPMQPLSALTTYIISLILLVSVVSLMKEDIEVYQNMHLF